ncbi:MAG: hypothetical protein PHI87_04235, partial [Candidatus Methanomethylophilus sp.]|nr:hypothetical protein [Methanomethylophilus sp.]
KSIAPAEVAIFPTACARFIFPPPCAQPVYICFLFRQEYGLQSEKRDGLPAMIGPDAAPGPIRTPPVPSPALTGPTTAIPRGNPATVRRYAATVEKDWAAQMEMTVVHMNDRGLLDPLTACLAVDYRTGRPDTEIDSDPNPRNTGNMKKGNLRMHRNIRRRPKAAAANGRRRPRTIRWR